MTWEQLMGQFAQVVYWFGVCLAIVFFVLMVAFIVKLILEERHPEPRHINASGQDMNSNGPMNANPGLDLEARGRYTNTPRKEFLETPRSILVEISKADADALLLKNAPVFVHPFDPIRVTHWADNQKLQLWAADGYRIEAVRYYMQAEASLQKHMFVGFPANSACKFNNCGLAYEHDIHRVTR
jgi:hypothetical protein